MSELLVKICSNKIKSRDSIERHKLTPGLYHSGWNDAVKNARGHGISISAFGDTKDKLVLHPGHLGYNFDYYWGKNFWSSASCWDKNVSDKEITKANKELLLVGNELSQLGYTLWVVYVRGNDKGYLTTYPFDINNCIKEQLSYDRVLFVFDFYPNKYLIPD